MPNSADSTDAWTVVEFDVEESVSELLADDLWGRGVAAIEELTGPADGLITLRTSLGESPHEFLAEIGVLSGVRASRVLQVSRSVTDTWRAHAVATWIDQSTALVPAWCDSVPGATNVVIEPGDQFGLGNHPTTVLASRCLLGIAGRSDVIADVGCGTGVLAIVAAMRSGCRTLVHDIAPGAREIVEANRVRNGLDADSVAWFDGLANMADATATVVVANILAPVLRDLSRDIRRVLAPGGKVVLSGMRGEQVDDVVECFSPCFVLDTREMDGWVAVVLSA